MSEWKDLKIQKARKWREGTGLKLSLALLHKKRLKARCRTIVEILFHTQWERADWERPALLHGRKAILAYKQEFLAYPCD